MRKISSTGIAILIGLIGLPGFAYAVDGVYEINSACVAGGCFPGDAPGFPVTIPAPGSYRLTGSLMVSALNTSAIQVSTDVDDVTIDLNGFSIFGPTVCSGFPLSCEPNNSGFGIDANNSNRVNVRNGTVSGFGTFGLILGSQARVSSLSITSNRLTGMVAGAGAIVEGSVVFSNGGRGIDCSVCVVRSNTVRGNGFDGIRVSGGSVVEGNSVTFNLGVGLSLEGTSGYAGNVITDNSGGNANPQVTSGIEIGENICGFNTTCP